MLWAILNKSWKQDPTKQQPYSHQSPIMKTIKVRQTRHVGLSWRSKDKLIYDILLWTPSHGWTKAGQPARTYIQQLCADTEYSLEDLLGVMDDRWVASEGLGNPCWQCNKMMKNFYWEQRLQIECGLERVNQFVCLFYLCLLVLCLQSKFKINKIVIH